MTAAIPEVIEDRRRIKVIVALPQASSQPKAAIAIALAGASVDEAKVVLGISAGALSPDEVAANINKRSGR